MNEPVEVIAMSGGLPPLPEVAHDTPQPLQELPLHDEGVPEDVEEEDNLIESLKLRRKIRAPFRGSLRKYVEHIDISGIDLMSTSELRIFYEEIRDTIRMRSPNAITRSLLEFGLNTIEGVGTKLGGLKLQHYADTCLNDDNVLESYDEIMLDYDMPDVGPEMRLAYTLIHTAMKVHTINSATIIDKDGVEVITLGESSVPEGLEEKYADL